MDDDVATADLASQPVNDVVQRLVSDVGRLQEVAITAGMPLLVNVVTLLAMLGVLLWIDAVMALVALVAVVVFLLVKVVNGIRRQDAEQPAPSAPPAPTPEEKLLTEIRDLLAQPKA